MIYQEPRYVDGNQVNWKMKSLSFGYGAEATLQKVWKPKRSLWKGENAYHALRFCLFTFANFWLTADIL